MVHKRRSYIVWASLHSMLARAYLCQASDGLFDEFLSSLSLHFERYS